jgi:hypothetical protein
MMAGVEKICEYSGDYPGWLMYGYKRNHIQICPQYRKLFRGADAHLIIEKVEKVFVFKDGGVSSDADLALWERLGFRGRVANEYTFRLVVSDPALAGEVNGEYVNWTTNMRQTIKRLKRMLRCRTLKVKRS